MQKPDGLRDRAAGRRGGVPRAADRARPLGRRPEDGDCAERRRVHDRRPTRRARTRSASRRCSGRAAAGSTPWRKGSTNRRSTTEYERKSVGAETTFPRDLPDGPELRAELQRLAESVARRLAASGAQGRTVVLKLRYANFRTITRQASRPQPTEDAEEIARDREVTARERREGGRPLPADRHPLHQPDAGASDQLGLCGTAGAAAEAQTGP